MLNYAKCCYSRFFLVFVLNLIKTKTVDMTNTTFNFPKYDYVTILPNGDVRPAYLFPTIPVKYWITGEPLKKIPVPTPRIIGGCLAAEGQIPFQVALIDVGGVACGGAIYSADTVLTLASCVQDWDIIRESSTIVAAGKADLLTAEQGEALSQVKSVLLHPGFDGSPTGSAHYDVGIIKLKDPFCFNEFIQPIPIAKPGILPSGSALVSGWGYTVKLQSKSDPTDIDKYLQQLKQAEVWIIPRDECKQIFKDISNSQAEDYAAHESAICARSNKGEGPCPGDAGAPLVCKDSEGKSYLCGLVIGGIGCGGKTPDFSVDLSLPKLHQWILQNAGLPGIPCTGKTDCYTDYNMVVDEVDIDASSSKFFSISCLVLLVSQFLLFQILFG